MLKGQIIDMLAGGRHKKKWSFTLENGRGETYQNNRPTLYGHSTYERGSVLAGRDQRVYVHQWDNYEEAKKDLAELKKELPKFKFDDCYNSGTSTHQSIASIVSHLPDDTDY